MSLRLVICACLCLWIVQSCSSAVSTSNTKIYKHEKIKLNNIEEYVSSDFFSYSEEDSTIAYLKDNFDTIIHLYDLREQKIVGEINLPLEIRNMKYNLYSRNDSLILGVFNTGIDVVNSYFKEYWIGADGIHNLSFLEIENSIYYPITDYQSNFVFYDLINGREFNRLTGNNLSNRVFFSDLTYEIKDTCISILDADSTIYTIKYQFQDKFKEYSSERVLMNDNKLILIVRDDIAIDIMEYELKGEGLLKEVNQVFIKDDDDKTFITFYNRGIMWMGSGDVNFVDLGANW